MRVRRGLVSAPLPCGCLAGIYEAWNGSIVMLVDARGDRCDDRSHYVNRLLDHDAGIKRPSSGLQDRNRSRGIAEPTVP